MSIPLLRQHTGRHAAPAEDLPAAVPVADPPAVPRLAGAQRAAPGTRAVPVGPRPSPADLRRVRDGIRRLDVPAGRNPFTAPPRPVPPARRLTPVPTRGPRPAIPAAQARARIAGLPYPQADGMSSNAWQYAALMREMDRITGTRGRGGAWNRRAAVTAAPWTPADALAFVLAAHDAGDAGRRLLRLFARGAA